MLSLTRIAGRARALDVELDARRALTRVRVHELHDGIHSRLTSPTALASSFAAGIVAGRFSDTRTNRDDTGTSRDEQSSRGGSGMRTALGYGRWALRVYLTQKVAGFLRSVA